MKKKQEKTKAALLPGLSSVTNSERLQKMRKRIKEKRAKRVSR